MAPEPPADPVARPWLPAVVLLLILAIVLAAPILGQPTARVLGSASSPTLDHLWGLWVTAEGLLQHGPFLRDSAGLAFPDGFRALQYEAPNLLLFLPGFWLGGGGPSGAALGWNLLSLGAPLLAGVGAWLLLRDELGDRPENAVGVAAFAGGAWMLASPFMGHSEYLAAALWPWHLWALGRLLAGGRWPWLLAAGLSLGAMAATASYLGVFLLLLEPPLALTLQRQAPLRRRALCLLGVALVALLVAGAFAVALVQPWPRGHGAFAGQLSLARRPIPGWRMVLHGLLRLVPGPLGLDTNEQAAYPGLVVLALGTLGAVVERRARPWLAVGLLATLLGAGVALRVGPQALMLPAGGLVQSHSLFAMVHWWQRIGVLSPLPLGVAAAFGARHLGLRLGWPSALALGLGLLILLDQSSFPRGWVLPPPSQPLPRAPALGPLLEALPPGGLVVYPLPLVHLPGEDPVSPGPYLVEQMSHGRPISTVQSLSADSTLRWSLLSRLVANRQAGHSGRASGETPGVGSLSPSQRACVAADMAALADHGFAGILLYRDRPSGPTVEALLREALGPPAAESADHALWPIKGPTNGARPCSLPEPAAAIVPVLGF